jgi:hypothetical protein
MVECLRSHRGGHRSQTKSTGSTPSAACPVSVPSSPFPVHGDPADVIDYVAAAAHPTPPSTKFASLPIPSTPPLRSRSISSSSSSISMSSNMLMMSPPVSLSTPSKLSTASVYNAPTQGEYVVRSLHARTVADSHLRDWSAPYLHVALALWSPCLANKPDSEQTRLSLFASAFDTNAGQAFDATAAAQTSIFQSSEPSLFELPPSPAGGPGLQSPLSSAKPISLFQSPHPQATASQAANSPAVQVVEDFINSFFPYKSPDATQFVFDDSASPVPSHKHATLLDPNQIGLEGSLALPSFSGRIQSAVEAQPRDSAPFAINPIYSGTVQSHAELLEVAKTALDAAVTCAVLSVEAKAMLSKAITRTTSKPSV